MQNETLEETVDLGAHDAYAAGLRDAEAATRGRPRVGEWLFRLPMLGSLRAEYDEHVHMYDRDLLTYFEATPRICDADRDEAREAVIGALRSIDGQQWLGGLTRRTKPVLTWVAVWPAACLFAIGAWLVAPPPAPAWRGVAAAWVVIAAFYLTVTFLAVFRAAEHHGHKVHIPSEVPKPRCVSLTGRALALLALVTAVAGHPLGEAVPALGSLLIALPLTLATVVLLALTIESIRKVQWRAGTYLAEVAILALLSALPRQHRPEWADWVERGVWTGVWASTALAGALAVLLLLMHLSVAVHVRRKSRHAIAEVVQTLLCLAMRIDDASRPEPERHELSGKFPAPDAYAVVWDLEFLARLIEGRVPRLLDTGDPTGNRVITDRCRGIAATVRQLKPDVLLNQRGCLDRLAGTLAGAVVPIAVGDWAALACATLEAGPHRPSVWARTLRWTGRVVAAAAPIGLVLGLRWCAPELMPEKAFESLVPVAVTWLLVSVVTWMDPSGGDRASSVKNLLSAVPGVRSS